MKRILGVGLAGLVALSLSAARPDAKADIVAAAKKLAEQPNYSWTSTPKSEGAAGGGQGQRGQAGPTEGKAEKDGCVCLSTKMGENTVEAVIKGEKLAIKTADGWKGGSELQPQQGGQQGRRDPSAFLARSLRTYKAPAADVQDLVEKVAELKDEGEGCFSGALTEEGAKARLSGGGRGGQNAPAIADPKGSAKFWIKDGSLVKYEVNVQGKMTFGEREIQRNTTTTVEIKEVGTTKLEIPEDAKKKLE